MGGIVIEKARIIAVEGQDEVNFVKALLKYLSISEVQLVDLKGKDNMRRIILALKNTPGFSKVKKLGFIRDADEDSTSVF